MAYSKVDELFWNDPLVRALPERARQFFLYLLTSPHRNRFGCYVLDLWYASADLQWPQEIVAAAMQELRGADRIAWDPIHRVVFIKRYLRHNTLENHKVVQGALGDLRSLPNTPLLRDLLASMEENKRAHYAPLLQALRNRMGNGIPNDSPNRRDLPLPLPSPSPSPSPEPTPSACGSHAHAPAHEAERVPESDPGPDPEADPLTPWLGEHASVLVDCPPAASPRMRRTLYQHYGPPGLRVGAWRRDDGTSVPPPERPRMLALALSGYAAEGHSRIVTNEFAGMVEKLARQPRENGRAPPEVPLTPAQYARYREIRGELEDDGMDAEEAAAEADQRARRE